MRPPLSGIKVVELAVALAAPSAAAVLGDWGAEVLKVEPLTGDPQRFNTQNAYFQLDNRGKRSLSIDVKTEVGRDVLLRLLDDADVFVTNIRPSALQRLGFDHDTISARCPRLVYAVVSGYGLTGAAADKAGYDIGAYWSRAGVAGALAGPGEPPVPRPAFGDHQTAIALVAAVSTALFERERTGEGRLVSTSLVRAGAWAISSDLTAHMSGENPEPGLRRVLYNPLLGCYQAGDGRWFWLLGLEATRHWPGVAAAIGREDLLTDERFDSFGGLITNRFELVEILDVAFAAHPMAEWEKRFAEHDVWWDPVQDFDAVVADPVMHEAGAFRQMQGGRTLVTPPADVGAELGEVAQAPELGQHTEEVLLELGFDWDDITALKEQGVIP
jgi:crotonobetainyl-CoA:carnitine CoA-transferase CaiB-like acyl-CoA transferase